MTSSEQFVAVFSELRKLLKVYAEQLVCVCDADDDYYLNTLHIMKNKKPLFFGAAQIKKNYVSYHLMPVYVFPELLQDISLELRQRMQGKSCFNFKSIDAKMLAELGTLTQAAYVKYKAEGFV